jgi:hypothetical protein
VRAKSGPMKKSEKFSQNILQDSKKVVPLQSRFTKERVFNAPPKGGSY